MQHWYSIDLQDQIKGISLIISLNLIKYFLLMIRFEIYILKLCCFKMMTKSELNSRWSFWSRKTTRMLKTVWLWLTNKTSQVKLWFKICFSIRTSTIVRSNYRISILKRIWSKIPILIVAFRFRSKSTFTEYVFSIITCKKSINLEFAKFRILIYLKKAILIWINICKIEFLKTIQCRCLQKTKALKGFM